jgi:TatD DNase family protein
MSIMLGVHPSSADAWSDDTRAALRRQIEETGAVAIGEIGLDFLRRAPEPDVQRRALIEQLDLALECDLPVVIHMRESEAELLRLLTDRTTLPPLLFHSYDGGPELTDFILATGSFVGVGGLATRQKSGRLRAELQRIPLAQIVLETDAPYLIPARQRGRRNTPAQVRTVASFLANLTANDDETISTTTTRNAFTYFGKLRTA